MFRISSSIVSLGTISVLFLAGCSSKNADTNPGGSHVNPSNITADVLASKAEKSEALSILAARLLTPTSFMHAYDVAGLALEQDSANPRAQMIRATLAPQMGLKGILTRVSPLANQTPESKKHLDDARAKIHEIGSADFEKFAIDGPADIWTVRDAQELIAQYTASIDQLRSTLSGLRDHPFTLKVNAGSLKRSADGKICEIKKVGDTYDFSNCDESQTIARTVNNVDLEIFKQQVAGIQVYLTTANAFDVSGIGEVGNKKTSKAELYAAILKDPRTGVLRQTNGLGAIPGLAQDAVIGVRMAMKMQNEYCPTGHASSKNRPGALFENGLCIEGSTSKIEATLKMVDTALAGGTVLVPIEGTPGLEVAPLRLFTHPVQNVRTEFAQFDACDQLVALGDGSLQGAFPNASLNLNTLLAKQKNCQH